MAGQDYCKHTEQLFGSLWSLHYSLLYSCSQCLVYDHGHLGDKESVIRTSYAKLSSGIPWEIPRVTCIISRGDCVYGENTTDKGDIPLYTTRERGISILYHAV